MTKAERHVLNEILYYAADAAMEELEWASKRLELKGDMEERHMLLGHLYWLRLAPSFMPALPLTQLARKMTRKAAEALAALYPGTCAICGCTDERACPGGCHWVPDPGCKDRDICSACELRAAKS